jgi:hypothetical protein
VFDQTSPELPIRVVVRQNSPMAISRADRRTEREPLVLAVFGTGAASSALDLLELVEFAWHDCYDEVTPSDEVIADMLVVCEGTLEGLIRAARLAITDSRDLRVAADNLRSNA